LSWLGSEWHKIVVGLIGLDTLWDRGVKLYERVLSTEEFIERRHGERRHMTLSEILQDAEMAKALMPQLEAFYEAAKALFEAVEAQRAKAVKPA
jgi:hypothetical protein